MDVRCGVFVVAISAFAQKQKKQLARSVSPDGKWEFRAGAAGEEEDFVIAKAGSDEISLVLSEEEYVDGLAEAMGRAPGYANVVWAPDSKRFAFNLQPGKGYQTTNSINSTEQVAQAGFAGIQLRHLCAARGFDHKGEEKAEGKAETAGRGRGLPLLASWQVRKWIDQNTVLLYARRSAKFEVNNDTQEVHVSFFLYSEVRSSGQVNVTRKSEVPENGVGGLNSEERKEINRIENDGRKFTIHDLPFTIY